MAKKKKKASRPDQDPRPAPQEKVEPVSEPATTGTENPLASLFEGPLDRAWLAASGLIIALASFLRFFWLELKPFHHDEGVNGFFLKTLFNDGIYKYDPANYHGPTLYYISLAFTKVLGFDTIPVRLSMAIFGVLTVVLALFLRRYIGTIGALFAALFLALSPGMVFISRYFIHEIFFVFLSLAIVVAVLLFIERQKAGPFAVTWMVLLLFLCFLPSAINLAAYLGGANTGAVWALRVGFFIGEAVLVYYLTRMLLTWDGGRPIYLILASASVALMFATKETAFITLGTMLIACFCIWLWRGIRFGDAFERNRNYILIGFHGLLLLAALVYADAVRNAWEWLSTVFFSHFRPHEPLVFSAVVFLIIAAIAAWVFFLLDTRRSVETDLAEPVELTWAGFRRNLGDRSQMILVIAAAATAFIYVSVLFFSSFFTYAEGVGKAFEAYAIWTKTGNKDHTMSGYAGYLKWGMRIEAPLFVISLLGALVALWKGKHRFAMFAGLWALGLLAAYSLIPYKTPWLALSFLVPMCIAAGYAVGELFASKNTAVRVASAALAVVGTVLMAWQSYQINFVRYDDEEMPYVYAHTRRGFLDMIAEIKRYAAKSGEGTEATIEIVSPDYWPMTWYLNDYRGANFHGNPIDVTAAEMIVFKKDAQDAIAIQKYQGHYKYVGVYPLRPGVNLVLLVRKDLADPGAQDLPKVLEYKPIQGVTS